MPQIYKFIEYVGKKLFDLFEMFFEVKKSSNNQIKTASKGIWLSVYLDSLDNSMLDRANRLVLKGLGRTVSP